MKKEVKHLYSKAIDSLILSIELFNRPSDSGRIHSVLIFMDHSFEMLLKASIIHNGGKIKDKKALHTIGFSACLNKAFSDQSIKFLSEEQVLTLQVLNGLRDAAQHYILEMSEQYLYFQAQAGLTLFRDIVRNVFAIELKTELPHRVLPLSTTPPIDIHAFFTNEISEIKNLLSPNSRKKLEANEKLRALAIMENSIQGNESQPSDSELKKMALRLNSGSDWNQIFPGVSTLNFTNNGYGPALDLRITKNEGVAVTIIPNGSASSGAVLAIKRVNDLDFYSLTTTDLVTKTKVSQNKLLAVMKELDIQNDIESFKEFKVGKQIYKRYSPKALNKLKTDLPNLNIEEIWDKHKSKKKPKYPTRNVDEF